MSEQGGFVWKATTSPRFCQAMAGTLVAFVMKMYTRWKVLVRETGGIISLDHNQSGYGGFQIPNRVDTLSSTSRWWSNRHIDRFFTSTHSRVCSVIFHTNKVTCPNLFKLSSRKYEILMIRYAILYFCEDNEKLFHRNIKLHISTYIHTQY